MRLLVHFAAARTSAMHTKHSKRNESVYACKRRRRRATTHIPTHTHTMGLHSSVSVRASQLSVGWTIVSVDLYV